MPNLRSVRWSLPPVLASLLLAGAILSGSARAAGYGELLRFNGLGTGASKGHKFVLEEETHAFGVDPKDNSIYVGDEKSGASEEEFRIQKYSAAGAYEAEVLLKPGGTHLPAGMTYLEDFDGIAVDSSKGRIYVLVTYAREGSDKVDPSKEVAGAVYAFSTTPSAGKLVPAEGANAATGLLASSDTLQASSEVQGKALLEPSGITVDPKTNEIVILGQVDEGGASGKHVALVRLSEKGVLESTYVDPVALGGLKAPDSPVVSRKGKIFFEDGNEIQEIPSEYASPPVPKTVFLFEEPESFEESAFKEPLVEFGEDANESSYGGGLTIVDEGAENEGRLVADAEVHEVEEDGVLRPVSPAPLAFHFTEVGSEEVKVSEIGWTGGQPGETAEGKPCIIGYAGNYFQVAGASGEKLFVLAPAEGEKINSEVLEFGPGGTGCPAARSAPSGLEATIDGIKVSNVTAETAVVLSAKLIQANILSVEWKFDDGAPTETIPTPAGEQTQTAEAQHAFAKGGQLKVEAVIHTDDLATPEVKVSTTLNVEPPPGSPKVLTNPASQTVVEGQNATFKATASGTPTPTIQWQESRNSGGTWANVGAGTSGGTSETLTVVSSVVAESGYQYRAVFTNSKDEAISKAATLTVETKAAHEAKEKAEKEKIEQEKAEQEKAEREKAEKLKAEREAGERVARENAEAAARAQQQAEEAAKKAQEEAAKKAQEEAASKEGAPSATVSGSSMAVSSSGSLSLKVSCAAGVKACTGTVTLRTLGAVSSRAASVQAHPSKASVLTLATGSFTIAGGQVKAITLHLSAKARKLLARSHTLKARAMIVAHNASGASSTTQVTVTLRAAKAKSHH